MRMQEKQTDKVIINVTRSAHGDWQEDKWVSLIHKYMTIIAYLYSGHIVQSTVRLRIGTVFILNNR